MGIVYALKQLDLAVSEQRDIKISSLEKQQQKKNPRSSTMYPDLHFSSSNCIQFFGVFYAFVLPTSRVLVVGWLVLVFCFHLLISGIVSSYVPV